MYETDTEARFDRMHDLQPRELVAPEKTDPIDYHGPNVVADRKKVVMKDFENFVCSLASASEWQSKN